MEDYASSNNGWVEMYLNALLGEGLSKEYEQGHQHDHGPDTKALYFLNKAIDVDEEAIVTSWRRAQIPTANMVDPDATRREYQAWRIWGMKRTRQEAERTRFSVDSEPGTPTAGTGPIPMPSESDLGRTASASDSASLFGTSWDPKRDSLSGASIGNKALASLAPVRIEPSNEPTAADALPSPGTGRSAGSEASAPNPFAGRVDKLHIVLASMHGLVRGENMELGKDADTGGQVKYVVELAKTLSHHPMVHRVDLLTRLIKDPAVDASYGEEEECMLDGQGEYGGAYIVRVKAGDPAVYLPKESLWPHVREFADYALQYIAGAQRRMHEASEPCNLYAVHGHYADAGEAAALIAHTLGCPMVLTGHSLGRNKLDHLKRQGTISSEQIEETYKISRRIEAEERALDAALMVITSTQQEVDLQWGLYDGYRETVAKALRLRPIVGHSMPVMHVCAPGLDFSSLKVELPADPMQLFVEVRKSMSALDKTLHAKFASEGGPSHPREDPLGASPGLSACGSAALGEPESPGNDRSVHFAAADKSDGGEKRLSSSARQSSGTGLMSRALGQSSRHGSRQGLSRVISAASLDTLGGGHSGQGGEPEIWKAINRFLRNPAKPVILAMSRPDAKKNITTLVKAFGENGTLRDLANLVLIMGNRGDLDTLAKGSQQVLTQVLKLIDKYDLYGSVAYPKAHKQADISDIYLLAKKTTGVFVNIALQEPFGLTLIEAAVHGAPIVATTHGGPVDIIKTLKNGKLVEPTDHAAVSAAILDIVLDKNTWHRYSTNGNKNILAYSWPSHCIKYLEELERLIQGEGDGGGHTAGRAQRRLPSRLSFEETHHELNSTITGELRKVGSNMSLPVGGLTQAIDDIDIGRPDGVREAPAAAAGSSSTHMHNDFTSAPPAGIRLRSRRRLVFAMLDSTLDVALLAEELQGVIDRNDGSLAVGLLTVLTLSEIKQELQAAGIRPESLDFLVCNCGAYVFCLADDGVTFVTDEDWERKIAYRWDKKLVTRTLTRMQVARAPPGKGREKRSDVLRMLTAADGVDFNDGNGPYHVLLALDPKEASPLQQLDNAALLSKVRKRTRHAGVRVNLTLQLAPGQTGAGGETQSVLHATPLRASRALALRHIMQTHGFELSAALFLCTPASVHKKGNKGALGTMLGTLCSDMAQLVEGAQRVVVVPPKTQVEVSTRAENERPEKAAKEGKRNAAAFERLKVSLEPYSEARVAVLDDAAELPEALQKALKPQ